MADPNRPNEIRIPDKSRIVAQCVDRYEEIVANGGFPEIHQLLEPVPSEHRAAALRELVLIDMDHGWRRRRGRTTGEYLREYPELRALEGAERELLRAEWELRRCHDETFDARAFSARHPELGLDVPRPSNAATAPTEPIRRSPIEDTVEDIKLPFPAWIGEFPVKSRLGEGRFGTVYLAQDTALDRPVAIKVVRESNVPERVALATLEHGARAMARVNHKNIVQVFGAGHTEDGRPYIVYEYVKGRPLDKRIAAGDFTLAEAVWWVIDLARGLHAAHKQHLVHRDIKPANILIDDSGTPRLTDFDLARRDDQFFADDRNTLVGTLEYMAPEQAAGQSHLATPASDIYSLGAVLYELLTGRRPFRTADREALLEQVKYRPPIAPSTICDDVPKAVEAVCLKALAKDPEDRPATAKEMADALDAALRAPPNWARRFWVLTAVAAAALAGATMLFQFRPRTAPLKIEALNIKAGPGSALKTIRHCPVPADDNYIIEMKANRKSFLRILVMQSGHSERPKGNQSTDKQMEAWFLKRDKPDALPSDKRAILVLALASDTVSPPDPEFPEFSVTAFLARKEAVIPSQMRECDIDEICPSTELPESSRAPVAESFAFSEEFKRALDTFCKTHNCTYRAKLFATLPPASAP